jgi:hypothetical protein
MSVGQVCLVWKIADAKPFDKLRVTTKLTQVTILIQSFRHPELVEGLRGSNSKHTSDHNSSAFSTRKPCTPTAAYPA